MIQVHLPHIAMGMCRLVADWLIINQNQILVKRKPGRLYAH